MRLFIRVCCCLQLVTVLLVVPSSHGEPLQKDWLIVDIDTKVTLTNTNEGGIELSNGIISRTFSTKPDFATIDFYSFEHDASLLRAINPEAVVTIDGIRYNVGGYAETIPRAYLNRTLLASTAAADPNAFHYYTHKLHPQEIPYPYTAMRGVKPDTLQWPPKGLRVDVYFKAPLWAPFYHQFVVVVVHYEMYQGIPLLRKWVTIHCDHPQASSLSVNVPSVEVLSLNQEWGQPRYRPPNPVWNGAQSISQLYVETDQPHGTLVTWYQEPAVSRAMPGSFDTTVNCSYQGALSVSLSKPFKSFFVHELVIGSLDMERHGLARNRMMRLLAPQVRESPVFFHMTNGHPAAVRGVIDQLAETGFEMLLYSFWSGFNPESKSKAYIEEIKDIVDYAHSKGIEVGGYDLISLTRHVQASWMAVDSRNRSTGSACFASEWYDDLTNQMLTFINETGISALETDGPYGGYGCAATYHKHHSGPADSVYKQNMLQGEFYKIMKTRNIFINQPDAYFYQGGNKAGMGYNENQYSLPRWQDISVSRQSMYDDTYFLPNTAGWMFVPLVDYHGGGKPAAFEPLSAHAQELEWALGQYFGAGVSCAWRGYELYDNNATRDLVTKWVSFFKQYRDILTSDIVHVRRPDMQSVDAFMHVNPHLTTRGLLMVFNPTARRQQRRLRVPLYYTGLQGRAAVAQQDQAPHTVTMDAFFNIWLPVDMAPLNITWYTIRSPATDTPNLTPD